MTRRTAKPSKGTSVTQRGAGAGTDMGSIIARAQRTGQFSSGKFGGHEMQFLDITSTDYMLMNNRVLDGRRAFDALPSRIRSRFQNDPYQFLRFVENPENRKEAIQLGLISETTPPPKRIHEMTAEEWTNMENAREEARREANPSH